ncbi:MAG: hypothetical protein WC740_01135 [Verrucomicrobiia bacterium]
MTRQRWFGWMAAGIVVLSTAGWLGAQDAQPPRPPQGGEGPGGGQSPGRNQQQFRPMMGMQAQMTATEDYVFILRGNTLYKYDVKTLALQGKKELEPPMPGRGQQDGGQQRPPPPQQ